MDEQKEQPPSYDSTLKEFIREEIGPYRTLHGFRIISYFEERLNMSENLWEEDPKIQQYVAMKLAEKVAKARSEGLSEAFVEGFCESFAQSFSQEYAESLVEGELLAFRKVTIKLVTKRFPILGEFVQFQLQKIVNLDTMEQLFDRIIAAEDELTVLLALNDVKA